MSRKKKLFTAATTFTAALGIGFVMQYGDAVASRIAPDSPELETVAIVSERVTSASVATLPQFRTDDTQTASLASLDLNQIPVIVENECAVTLDAQPLPLAMVALGLHAPCHVSATVTFHHQGMMFAILTDTAGRADIVVPALSQDAFFLATLEDGTSASTETVVADLSQYDRAVLQWQGVEAVGMHAREFGADYGSAGHVWSAAAREVDFLAPPKAGFMVRLGDEGAAIQPMIAEVYTFPTGQSEVDGDVTLTVEAEITADNCGREVVAQTIQIDPLAQSSTSDLAMTMPDCDTVGSFLVLKNMLKDLTLAAK